MEFPSHDLHGFDALPARPAEPIGHVLSLGGAVVEWTNRCYLLDHVINPSQTVRVAIGSA